MYGGDDERGRARAQTRDVRQRAHGDSQPHFMGTLTLVTPRHMLVRLEISHQMLVLHLRCTCAALQAWMRNTMVELQLFCRRLACY